ncbi:MAG: hypothetical protein RL328_1523 [Acidobacteriota bacterium]|jgi:acetylornithine deacetylase/succinyl-diaminopimelate desuccinylase-like protein
MRRALVLLPLTALLAFSQSPQLDWVKVDEEAMRHFQALVQIDTSDPPGNETRAVDYLKQVLDAEGIPSTVVAKEPSRANLIARLKGSGARRPLLLMAHTDVVQVDPAKWATPPFGAVRKDGYVYGRGTLDDKPDLTAALMTILLLKRMNVSLDRDIIFLAEAGEEASTGPGIEFVVNEHFPEIDAEYCLAEGGGVPAKGGQARWGLVQTTEKQPKPARLVATGPAGHGSRPLRTSAIVHLTRAVEKIAMWDPPMRLNDTTRTYFEKLSTLTPAAEAARYKDLLNPQKAAGVREYLAVNDPGKYSMLHTSISPNIIKAGYQINVIPSEAEATLDIRALPGEDMPAFYALMAKVIDDPTIKIIPESRNERPAAAPSRLDTDAFRAVESAYRKVYNIATVPTMLTGATDMAFLRAKGMQCYGIGAMVDEEDAPLGFGAHSDQERIREEALYKHVQFFWDVANTLSARR